MPVDADVVHRGIKACGDVIVFILGEDDIAALAASRKGLEDVRNVICLVAVGVHSALQASVRKCQLLDTR